jgi:hypothetical protein
MKIYKLNGERVEIVSRRSVNGRRQWKVKKPDGTICEVLYRDLEREEPDLTIVEVYKFTPKQWKLIKKGTVSGPMKQFWIRQNRAHR